MNFNFSIVILTYNCKDTIILLLNSIISQKINNLTYELIIIDDASDDGTQNLLTQLQKKYNLTLILLNKNKGNGICKNLAVQKARSNYIVFIDDHAILNAKNILQIMYDKITSTPKLIGVCGNYFSPNKKDWNLCRDIRRRYIYKKNKKDLIICPKKFIPFSIVISIIRKNSLTDNFKFPENFKQNAAEDVFFQIKQHEQGNCFVYLGKILIPHSHNLNFKKFLLKFKRELGGFLYVVRHFIDNKYFQSIYTLGFFSCPTFFWISLILHLLLNNSLTLFILIAFAISELCLFCPIFKSNFGWLNNFKAYVFCLLSEHVKFFVIIYLAFNIPTKFPLLVKLLYNWEIKKIKSFFIGSSII